MATEIKIDKQAIDRLVEGEVMDNIEKWADEIVEQAQTLAPVKTGRLRQSIRKEDPAEKKIDIIADTEYSLYIEYGTKNRTPQPFLRPAMIKVIKDKERTSF